MGKSGSSPNIPPPPKLDTQYQKGVDVYLKNLPQMLQTEQDTRSATDPQRVSAQQNIQQTYGPTQYGQEVDAVRTLDPTYWYSRENLGRATHSDPANGAKL